MDCSDSIETSDDEREQMNNVREARTDSVRQAWMNNVGEAWTDNVGEASDDTFIEKIVTEHDEDDVEGSSDGSEVVYSTDPDFEPPESNHEAPDQSNDQSKVGCRYFFFFFQHNFCVKPENPEGTQLIVVSMNMIYDMYPTLPGIELTTCSVPSASRSH